MSSSFFQDQIGEVLSRTGVLILLIAVSIVSAFLISAFLIPVPAMRGLGLQAAILGSFNLFAMIFLFPAILALDLRRISAGKIDFLCCYSSEKRNLLEWKESLKKKDNKSPQPKKLLNKSDEQWPGSNVESGSMAKKEEVDKAEWTLSNFAVNHLAKWIQKAPVKLLITTFYFALTLAGIWGATHVQDGLNLTDVVPRNTSVFHFLDAQDKYFGFYNMFAVTKGHFEYPQNQKLLYDYHNAFVRIPNIIKDDNGGLPEFWLPLFRSWLVKLQNIFDDHYAEGKYKSDGWYENATEEGILAFKLMVQTGHVDYPVDFTLQSRNRLVDEHGIINPNAFYNYMTAWYSNDAMAYSFSQASIVPKPREWVHSQYDDELRIPKSPPIAYAQIPFYMNNLGETSTMVETIRQVRSLCDKFEEKGLPNFPRGVPFTFWEQYLTLRFWLLIAVAGILAAVFLVLAFVFMSPWLSSIGVTVIGLMLVQLFGFMGLLGIRLSAVPAVILILAAGMGVQFTVHILMVSLLIDKQRAFLVKWVSLSLQGFATSIGNKNRRVSMSLQYMFAPVFHGAVSTFLGIAMLAFSDFDFIYRYVEKK